jgi:hypothetical protein
MSKRRLEATARTLLRVYGQPARKREVLRLSVMLRALAS